jgi:hypothetical protein
VSDAYEIGEVVFTPHAQHLHIRIREGQDQTRWSVAGVRVAVAYLQAWLEEVPPEPVEEDAERGH